MTTLVSLAAYRRLTGDTSTADDTVTAALADAEKLIAEYLRRPLDRQERTERCRLYRQDSGGFGAGWAAYPSATPIDAEATTGYTVEGVALVGVGPDDGPWMYGQYDSPGYATVTYTGGWTAETLPLTIAREIARTARALTTASATAVLAGAASVKVGDISVAFGSGGAAGGALDETSQSQLRPYVRRRAS
jgi:hypothetical protein